MTTIDRVIAWLAAHPEADVTAALTALANAWRALPSPWRSALEHRAPRVVGLVRAAYEALPSLVGAGLAIYWQVIRGLPKRVAVPNVDAPPAATPVPPDAPAVVPAAIAPASTPPPALALADPARVSPDTTPAETPRAKMVTGDFPLPAPPRLPGAPK